MQGQRIAVLETRTGAHLGELIARRGGTPLLAPALAEEPDVDPAAVRTLIETWRRDPMKLVIFQTGVGTRALFQATDALSLTAAFLELLAASIVAVRGPKPQGELGARHVRIDHRANSPFTTADVQTAVSGIAVDGCRVLIQRYGADNPALRGALEARGARVHEIATYRWALPQDLRPLVALLDSLRERRIDAVVFTSAVQVRNLFAVAEREGNAATLADDLNRCLIASIGPVCSRALRESGVLPSFEASPPKLGFLITQLEAALGSRSPGGAPRSTG
jgi:uroporphyrinogen-III synthase